MSGRFIDTKLPINNFRANIKCPNCGESYFQELYSTSTVVYYPPIYKDGVNINPDKNTVTTSCECINCKSIFSYNNKGEINLIIYGGDNSRDDKVICINN